MATSTVSNTENEILVKMGKPYAPVLNFIWALHHLDAEVKVPSVTTRQDEDTIACKETLRNELVPPLKKRVTLNLTEPTKSPVLSHDGAILAMTKLSA